MFAHGVQNIPILLNKFRYVASFDLLKTEI